MKIYSAEWNTAFRWGKYVGYKIIIIIIISSSSGSSSSSSSSILALSC